jgi:uncharacterized protein
VSVGLLDANVLIALMWPAHESHSRVQTWFRRNQSSGWATCPFTQTALVRILSNPAFSRDAVSPIEAHDLLAANVARPGHHFWPAEIDLASAIRSFRLGIVGHRQVSDAYLLGLAVHYKGTLVTMDKSIRTMASPGTLEADSLIEI